MDILSSVEGSEISSDGLIVVQSNGSAEFVNNFQLTAFFGMNLQYWPFDSHKCTFELESRLNPRMTIEMFYYGKEELSSDFVSSEWQMDGVTFGRAFWESKNNLIFLAVQIMRQGHSYRLILIASATLIIIMTLAGFWLPVQAGEKILSNGIVSILITILMLYFEHKLPNMGVHTPLVVQFCTFALFMTSISILITIFVLTLSRNQHFIDLPWSIKRVLESKYIRWLALSFPHRLGHRTDPGKLLDAKPVDIQIEDEEEDNDYDDIQPESHFNSVENVAPKEGTSIQDDWILLATVIDRLTFIVYSFIFIIIAIVYHV